MILVPSECERGIVKHLEAILSAGFPDVAFLAGTSLEVIPPSKPSVIIALSFDRPGGDYYTGKLRSLVNSPSKVEGATVEAHAALSKEFQRAMCWTHIDENNPEQVAERAATLASLEASLLAEAKAEFRGQYLSSVGEAQDKNCWQVIGEAVFGLRGPVTV